MVKYVWIDVEKNTMYGPYSETALKEADAEYKRTGRVPSGFYGKEMLPECKSGGMLLVKYECLNDEEFDLTRWIRSVKLSDFE